MADFPYVKEKWLKAIAEIRNTGGVYKTNVPPTTRGIPRSFSEPEGFIGNPSGGGEITNPIRWEAKYWLGTATAQEVRRMAKG